ncbi:MAG: hypothetical protein ACR2HI_06190, partial [Gaiella sp.]
QASRRVGELVARAAAEEPAQADATAVELADDETSVPPPVAQGTTVSYLDPSAPWASEVGAAAGATRVRAFLAARVALRYDDTAAGIDEQQELEALYGPLDAGFDLDRETLVDYDDRDFREDAPPEVTYVLPQAPIAEPRFFATAAKEIQRRLVENRTLDLQRNRALKLVSHPGETPEGFARRSDDAAQKRADAEAAKLRDRLETKQARLERALEQASRRVEELETDARSRQTNELVAGAGAVLGALLGGRRSARSITSAIGGAASRRGMSARVAERRESAIEKVEATRDDLTELEQELLDEIEELDERWSATAAEVETVSIRLEATDVRVVETRLVWVPTG